MREYLTKDIFENLNTITQDINLNVSLSKAKKLDLLTQIKTCYKIESIKEANKGDTILLMSNCSEVMIGIFDNIVGNFIYTINIYGEETIIPLDQFYVYKITKNQN